MSTLRTLASRISRLERELRHATVQPQLAYSSIENGAIESYDADGNLTMLVGTQYDGTATAAVVNGPPPPTPFVPGVAEQPGGLSVVWSGDWADPDAVAPMDFSKVEIHVSATANFTPDATTMRGSFASPLGGEYFVALDVIQEYYVCLVARSESGRASDPSGEVAGTPKLPSTPATESVTVTAIGPQTITLTSEPDPGSERLFWNGIYQSNATWTRSGLAVTIPDPEGDLQVNDVLIFCHTTH